MRSPHPQAGPGGRAPTGDLGLEAIAVGALVAFATIAGVVWAGAQLASLVAGHGPVPYGLGDAGRALLELPGRATDPASAWPPAQGARLPGPWVYWGCTAIAALAAGVMGTAVALRWRPHRRARRRVLGVEADAGFARPTDLKRLTVTRPQPGRLTLGRAGRRLIAAEAQTSLAVIGPTGCGKTAGFAIPALLEWQGPIIATSVKNDLLDAALEHRRQRGIVWIYDPTQASGHATARWTPLDACRSWAGAMRIAAWLCEAAQPRLDTVTDGDYWYTQARKALAPYLHAAALDDRTMTDVVRWIDMQEQDDVERILKRAAGFDDAMTDALHSPRALRRRQELEPDVRSAEISAIRAHLARMGGGPGSWEQEPPNRWPRAQQLQLQERIDATIGRHLIAEIADDVHDAFRATSKLDALIAAEAVWQKEQRIRSSIFATVENVLAGYADPGVGSAATPPTDDEDSAPDPASRIDLERWLDGDHTIFIVAPAHEQARLRPVLNVLVQQTIRNAYDRANANGGTLEHPCLVLLDEAGNIAPLKDLPGYASTARSHGITLVSIWQDLAQIKAIYGDRAQTVLNNHRAKLFGTGIADQATLDYVSRLIGDQRQTEYNVSGDLHGQRRTISEHHAYRRTAPADVLRRIAPNQAVLLYGSELPAHLRLRPWYLNRA